MNLTPSPLPLHPPSPSPSTAFHITPLPPPPLSVHHPPSALSPTHHTHHTSHTHHAHNVHQPARRRLPPPTRPPACRRRRRRPPYSRPHIAWLCANPLHDACVLAAAHAAALPTRSRVLPLRAPLPAVLARARVVRAAAVHAHVLHAAAHRPCFAASAVVLVLAGGTPPVRAATPPCGCRLAVAAGATVAAGAPVAAGAVAPALLETRDDSVTKFFGGTHGDDGSLVEEVQLDPRSLWERTLAWLTRVYLPQGFPHTTTPDYISFTKYRTLQNLASAIMQVISTEALLFGLGLGKKVAAGAAATSWVLKDGASYVAKIGYGSVFGSKFDDDPKSWRIAADVVEDVGGAIEILTPLFGRAYFLPLASLAVCLRGMSLMTGTATRHVVYRSLAATGMQNTGDIATKGESQGVTMKMLGLGTGILVSSRIGQNYYALLAAYSLLAAVHVVANWRSVQCVQFSFFNKQRASIVIDSHLNGDPLPSPYDVSHSEKIVLPPWRGFEPAVKIGVRVKDAVTTADQLEQAVKIFKGERFLIFSDGRGKKVRALLRTNATSRDALRAYYTVKRYLRSGDMSSESLAESLRVMKRNIKTFESKAAQAGWDTRHMLLTDGQTRVTW